MAKRTIIVIEAPQGAGKTEHMRNEAIQNGGLYVFACPTIELIREQVQWIKVNHPSYRIEEVHSKAHRKKSVVDEVDFRRQRIEDAGIHDAIIFVTHEGLMSADFDAFRNWHLRIDEVPLAVQSGKIAAGQSKALYDQMLVERDVGGEWGHYVLAQKASWKSLSGDDATSPHSEFFKQAQRETGVIINRSHWKSHKEIHWFSVWSPSYLNAFVTIHVAASNYLKSLGARVIRQFSPDACNFVVQPLPRPRTGQPKIEVYYFTDSHKGTTADWDMSDGRLLIKEIADYLTANVTDLGFWSANEIVYKLMEHRIPGKYISPKSMGLNKYRDLNKCAFVYSEMPQLSDRALKTASGITDEHIKDAREFETIRQFIMRGAIRNLDYAGDYAIYLYGKEQADMVRSHLTNSGFRSVTVSQVVLPTISKFEKVQKPRVMTPEEKISRQREQAKNRQRKRRNKSKDEIVISKTNKHQISKPI